MLQRTEEWYKRRFALITKREALAVRQATPKPPRTPRTPRARRIRKPKTHLFYGQAIVWKDWNKYLNITRYLTRIADLSQVEHIELRDGANYQLDHIVSIWDGYKHNIQPALIADLSNLRVIPTQENKDKGSRSPELALLAMIELNKTKIRCDEKADNT